MMDPPRFIENPTIFIRLFRRGTSAMRLGRDGEVEIIPPIGRGLFIVNLQG
jgi:hypothetical protein